MNFIGHARVALWSQTDPRFVLGSMLPDFAGMARARLAATHEEGALAAGIALHHRTDAAFHGIGPFVTLLQDALDELSARGVPRGPARAVSHIGVEMLIDGELVHDAQVASAYTDALRAGDALESAFAQPEGAHRFALLRTRLLAHGVPYDYQDPASVLRRLQFVLGTRPRLALDAAASAHVLDMLPALQRKVVLALPSLLGSVRAALG